MLTKLKHSIINGKKEGEKILMIPVKANSLYISDKGNVFLEFQGWEKAADKRRDDSKDTHIVHQSLPKEVREALKAKNEYPPTLGNLIDWGQHSAQEQAPETMSPGDLGNIPEEDDLPF